MTHYPRVYIKPKTHLRVVRLAKKHKTTMIALGDKIVNAGIKVLGL